MSVIPSLCLLYLSACYTCRPVIPVCLFYMSACYTCLPVIPVCLLYLSARYTCLPVTPVCLLYLSASCICLSFIPVCMLYSTCLPAPFVTNFHTNSCVFFERMESRILLFVFTEQKITSCYYASDLLIVKYYYFKLKNIYWIKTCLSKNKCKKSGNQASSKTIFG